MNTWGKNLTKKEAIQEIDNLRNRIYEIEHSREYAERSEAGDDTLWYQVEAYYEEIDYLKAKYDIEDDPVDGEYDDDASEVDWDA